MHQFVDFKILNPSHLTISMQDLHIVLYTLQYSYFHGVEKENLSNNQKFLEFIIIIFCYSCDLKVSYCWRKLDACLSEGLTEGLTVTLKQSLEVIINSRGLFKVALVFSLHFEIVRFFFYFSVNYKDLFCSRFLKTKLPLCHGLKMQKRKKLR